MKGYIKRHKFLSGFVAAALFAIPLLVWAQTAGYTILNNLELIDNPFTSATEGNLIVNGTYTGEGNFVLENGEQIDNDTDAIVKVIADDDAVTLLNFDLQSSNAAASMADGDNIVVNFKALDDGGTLSTWAQIVTLLDDVSAATEDSTMKFAVTTAGTTADELHLTGAGFSPAADGGLTLGTSALKWGAAHLGGTLAVTGAATLSSTLAVTGAATYLKSIITYNTSATPRAVTAAEAAGTVFVVAAASAGAVTFNLPPAAAGMWVSFIDNDATAADDLVINPDDADTINGGSAGVSWNQTEDVAGKTITLIAIDATQWLTFGEDTGEWATGS